MEHATPKSTGYVSRAYITRQARNTILAALRYYQQGGQGEPDRRTDAIHEIATNSGDDISLDAIAIDSLCADLNAGALELARPERAAPTGDHEDSHNRDASEGPEDSGLPTGTQGTPYTVIGRYLDVGHVFVTHVRAPGPTEAACDALHRMSGSYQPEDPDHPLDDVTAWELSLDAKIVSILEGHHHDQAVHL